LKKTWFDDQDLDFEKRPGLMIKVLILKKTWFDGQGLDSNQKAWLF
jgi:hypothetical protein